MSDDDDATRSRALLIAAEIVLRMRLDDVAMRGVVGDGRSVAEWLHARIVKATQETSSAKREKTIEELFGGLHLAEDRFHCTSAVTQSLVNAEEDIEKYIQAVKSLETDENETVIRPFVDRMQSKKVDLDLFRHVPTSSKVEQILEESQETIAYVMEETEAPVSVDRESEDDLLAPAVVPTSPSSKLIVVTYNVSWESTKPTTKPGSSALWQECKNNVSKCRGNIINAIANASADLVALQEVPPQFFGELKKNFESSYKIKYVYDRPKYGPEGQVTMWKRASWLHAAVIQQGIFKRGNPFTVIQFETFTFYNVHLPHTRRRTYYFEKLPEATTQDVVIAGDFNFNPGRSLTLHGKPFTSSASAPLKTCCDTTNTDAQHSLAYDHIYGSLSADGSAQVVDVAYPASDHRPVRAVFEIRGARDP